MLRGAKTLKFGRKNRVLRLYIYFDFNKKNFNFVPQGSQGTLGSQGGPWDPKGEPWYPKGALGPMGP